MRDTNSSMRFAALAREVFAWDAAISWIALDEPGSRLQWEWRDREIGVVATATTVGPPVTIDPLLLTLAESHQDTCNHSGKADSQHLRFVIAAYRGYSQIVTKFGRYGRLNIGVDPAGDAYQVGMRLAGLLDQAEILV